MKVRYQIYGALGLILVSVSFSPALLGAIDTSLFAQVPQATGRALSRQPGLLNQVMKMFLTLIGNPIIAILVIASCGYYSSKCVDAGVKVIFFSISVVCGLAFTHKNFNWPYVDRLEVEGMWFWETTYIVTEFSTGRLFGMIVLSLIVSLISFWIFHEINQQPSQTRTNGSKRG